MFIFCAAKSLLKVSGTGPRVFVFFGTMALLFVFWFLRDSAEYNQVVNMRLRVHTMDFFLYVATPSDYYRTTLPNLRVLRHYIIPAHMWHATQVYQDAASGPPSLRGQILQTKDPKRKIPNESFQRGSQTKDSKAKDSTRRSQTEVSKRRPQAKDLKRRPQAKNPKRRIPNERPPAKYSKQKIPNEDPAKKSKHKIPSERNQTKESHEFDQQIIVLVTLV